jgi:ligand-binding sensor domain-containing protein
MSKTISRELSPVRPRDITVRLRADLALRELPTEEPSSPVHPGWKTFASFRHVNALAAGHGELWAVTWGGVVRWRFDDHRVTFTRFASEHGLPGSRFHCIALDVHGHLWVGGPGVGLNTFEGEHWHTLMTDDGLPSNDVCCIASGADGRLWVGTRRGLGYIALDDETLRWRNQRLHVVGLPAEEIRTVAVETDSTLWLGTDWGLYQLKPDGTSRRYTTQDGLPCLQVTQLASDRQGHLWVGTAAGVCLLDDDHITVCQGLDQPVLSLTVGPGGTTLWAVTPESIAAYTPEGVQVVDPYPALTGDAQGRAVALDETGRSWLGYTEGVTQQFPPRVLMSRDDIDQMTKGENSLCNSIMAVELDASGRVWAGTSEGLWYLEHNVWHRCQPGIELASSLINVQAMAFSLKAKCLWVGGWREDNSPEGNGSGLRQFIGTTEVPLIGEMPELPYVDALTCDAQGCVWVAAEGAVRGFDGQQWEQLPALPVEASSEVIQALALDERRNLWCGTTGGLWHYDGGWHKTEVDAPVQALAHEGKDLWIGTTIGLKQLSGRRKRRWIHVDSLSNVNVTALAIGQDGVVWAGTSCGLARITGDDCQVFTTRKHGLVSDAVQALALDGGTLWIGTVNGISRFIENG